MTDPAILQLRITGRAVAIDDSAVLFRESDRFDVIVKRLLQSAMSLQVYQPVGVGWRLIFVPGPVETSARVALGLTHREVVRWLKGGSSLPVESLLGWYQKADYWRMGPLLWRSPTGLEGSSLRFILDWMGQSRVGNLVVSPRPPGWTTGRSWDERQQNWAMLIVYGREAGERVLDQLVRYGEGCQDDAVRVADLTEGGLRVEPVPAEFTEPIYDPDIAPSSTAMRWELAKAARQRDVAAGTRLLDGRSPRRATRALRLRSVWTIYGEDEAEQALPENPDDPTWHFVQARFVWDTGEIRYENEIQGYTKLPLPSPHAYLELFAPYIFTPLPSTPDLWRDVYVTPPERTVEICNVLTRYGREADGQESQRHLMAFSTRPQDWGDAQRYHYEHLRVEWWRDGQTLYVNNAHCYTDVVRSSRREYVGLFTPGALMFLEPGEPVELCAPTHVGPHDFWESAWGPTPPYYERPEDGDEGLWDED